MTSKSRLMPFRAIAVAAIFTLSATAQVLVPGEFTDPGNLRRQVAPLPKGYEPPEALKFPYIATYYVQPTVTTADSAEIKYFVTDWDSSKVRFHDDSFRFDVMLEYGIDGAARKSVVQRGVKSGDGVFVLDPLPKGEYVFCIWARDA